MCIEEVVGAFVGEKSVTMDARRIESAVVLGRSIEYITRERANQSPDLISFAAAPTLFVLVSGIKCRPRRYRRPHDAAN
jgi:hypothetical protein